jgi:membrane-associated phospholipid phosphatase
VLVRLGKEVQALPRRVTARAGSTGARVLLGLCIAILVASSVDVTHHGVVARADPHIAYWSYRHITGALHVACEAVTQLGDAGLLAVLVVVALAGLVRARRRFDAALLAVSAGATAVLTSAMKEAFHRDRPIYVDPVHGPKSFSFPSGHSSGAFTVYLLLAILLTVGLSTRVRSWAIAAACALATLIAASRVLLPVHFLSDVIAGTAIGLAVVAAAVIVRTAYART